MNDNRTEKAKDQQWLNEVIRRAFSMHDNYHDNMSGIFAFQNGESKGMLMCSSPVFEFEIAIRLLKHFQGVTEVNTMAILKFIKDQLDEA